jgi:hypothetical protein
MVSIDTVVQLLQFCSLGLITASASPPRSREPLRGILIGAKPMIHAINGDRRSFLTAMPTIVATSLRGGSFERQQDFEGDGAYWDVRDGKMSHKV